jgi:CubicO group peptidase (beta-lactamase class C family)
MQLIEEGKLTLEDKLIQYIPELKMEGAGEITIRHLLQMKSGLGSYFDNEYFQNNYQQLRNMEDYLPALVDLELYFEPGSSRRYSNAGYELLGILVQRISGKNYYDFVRENVYNKAKMLHTDAYERDQLTDNLALGYSQYKESDFLGSELPVSQKGKFEQDVNQRHAVKGTAAGGGYTTAEDLYHFVLALQQNKLLDKKHTDLIFNRFEEKEARYPSYRKGGGSVGINAMINADFEKNYVIIVLSNFDPPTASDLASRLAKTIELGTF